MLFLHPWLLLGLLGIALPLLLHLLNRHRSGRREWGAMLFLAASLRKRRRRVMLEEILLMATRCLLVAFAALLFARPFLRAGSALPWAVVSVAALLAVVGAAAASALWSRPDLRKRIWIATAALAVLAGAAFVAEGARAWLRALHAGARDIAIVLDGSSSMTLAPDGVANFDRAKEVAEKFIQSAPRNAAFALVVGGSAPQALVASPTADRRQLLRLLDAARPAQGTFHAPDALALAITALAQGDNANKQILVIGDGQGIGWNFGEEDVWAQVADLASRLPQKPSVVWRTLPVPSGLRNLTVASIDFSREVVGTDREVRIDVTVANNGEEAATPAALTLDVPGRSYVDKSIGQLQPGESRVIAFRHRFPKPGTHPVTATLDIADDLPGDNSAMRVAPVRGSLRVLVVEGARSRRLADRPGAFIALALAPDESTLAEGKEKPAATPRTPAPRPAPATQRFLVQPTLVTAADLASATNLSPYSAVVLADVPRLPSDAAARLATYVEQGGGLLVVNAAHSRPDFYNGWADPDGRPVLPLSLQGDAPAAGDGVPVDPDTFAHPALVHLASHGDLSSAIFEHYWRTAENDLPGVRIGARLFDGTPLVADRRLGKGRVLQFAAALDPGAGNLISRQSFLPMVHELTYYLARPVVPDLNLPPSRGAALALAGGTMPDAPGAPESERGLRATYRAGRDDGQIATIRIDKHFSIDLYRAFRELGIPEKTYVEVEWTGALAVPHSGRYRVYARANIGEARVSFADDKARRGLIRSAVEVDLDATRRHDIKIVFKGYCQRGAWIDVRYSAPGVPDTTIPGKAFSPVRVTDRDWVETTPVRVLPPDGAPPVPAMLRQTQDSLTLHLPERLVPGLYAAEIPAVFAPQLAELAALSNGFARLSFCVATDGDESRLARALPEETAFVGRFLPFSVADNAEDMDRAMNGAAIGRELWRHAAFPLLALLLAEIALTRWITQQRRTGEEGKVDFGETDAANTRFAAFVAELTARRAGSLPRNERGAP